MKQTYIHILSLLMTTVFGVTIAWIYWVQPRNLDEVSIKARETIESATSKAQVVTATYTIDQPLYLEGLAAFRKENYVLARDRLAKSDPERRDANVQFYIAYAFYRQGWGRLSNDDEMFKQGLVQLQTVDKIDKNFRSSDPDLKLSTPAELQNELNDGMRVTADDFNPFKLSRERQ